MPPSDICDSIRYVQQCAIRVRDWQIGREWLQPCPSIPVRQCFSIRLDAALHLDRANSRINYFYFSVIPPQGDVNRSCTPDVCYDTSPRDITFTDILHLLRPSPRLPLVPPCLPTRGQQCHLGPPLTLIQVMPPPTARLPSAANPHPLLSS